MKKVAIVILSDTETDEGLGRVYNGLSAAKEFMDAGDEVQVFFDGTGTRWPGVLVDNNHPAHNLYQDTFEVIKGACAGCAAVFGAEESVAQLGISLVDDVNGQPSYKQMLDADYQVLTF